MEVLQVNSGIIQKWLNTGDLYNLEKLILRGQGQKLIGEKGSNESRVRHFLKQVPEYLVRKKFIYIREKRCG